MVIIVDIDGTIADTKERARKYLETSPKDWDKFYDSCAEDKPIQGVINVVKHLEQTNYVIFVSGRRGFIYRFPRWPGVQDHQDWHPDLDGREPELCL